MLSLAMIRGGYPLRPLGEVVQFLDFRRRPVRASDRVAGPYPYYGANGIQDRVADYIFDEPLVLLAEDGGHFEDPDRGIAYRISGKTWVNNHAHVLRPSATVDCAYLARVLENYDVRPFIAGTTRSKLTQAGAAQIRIPIPPIEEQQRIADILDRADLLRTKRREIFTHLDSLTRSIFLDMFGHPCLSPTTRVRSLTELCEQYSGGTPSKARTDFWDGEIPWFSAKDMKSVELYDSEDHIAETVLTTTSLRLLPADTVIMVVRGMILVHTIPVSITTVPATINQDLKALLPREPINPTFLLWAIRSQHDYLLSSVSTAAHGTKRLDAQALRSIMIPRPGHRLEAEFAERAAAVRVMLRLSRDAGTALDSLFTSLQQRAFVGML